MTFSSERETIGLESWETKEMENSMFGILEKMDRYSNKLMAEDEKINFIQEIVDLNMVWDMHSKYIGEALTLIGAGKVTSKELEDTGFLTIKGKTVDPKAMH
ncbi:MAG: hypothetical protein HRT90_11440 [Candidatus Margulisbacteria bacterium]|nr:hypothetical protein [Candidatus Margulisiibacteriota bacterium]